MIFTSLIKFCLNISRSLSFILVFPFILTPALDNLNASTHSNLKDRQQLERFKKISLKLMCQCGCKMLLEHCNHFTCMAWSMRSVIDSLILNGYSDKFIRIGFEKGFAELTQSKKIMPILQGEIYSEYKKKYESGFGQLVYSEPESYALTIGFILISSLVTFLFVILFIRRNKKRIVKTSETKDLSQDEEALWNRLYRG